MSVPWSSARVSCFTPGLATNCRLQPRRIINTGRSSCRFQCYLSANRFGVQPEVAEPVPPHRLFIPRTAHLGKEKLGFGAWGEVSRYRTGVESFWCLILSALVPCSAWPRCFHRRASTHLSSTALHHLHLFLRNQNGIALLFARSSSRCVTPCVGLGY